ncbi:hypothetical protein P389DRAFT_209098 [Cystobasidium minutum MCA 4210]|uniref:uncharacterized protein n=1 Tax=Cystobasidium minutum MCA 4210 TaxID=1397322 RepID=UPI0034CE930A|eukprot:jgi/Rhomi1/209098/estExt_Genemark1.C_2_t20401
MMLFDKASGAKLRVVCLTDSVMLTPNASSSDYGDEGMLPIDVKPTTGGILEGQVILTLPTAKRCKKIQVELIGRQNISVQGMYESYEVLRSKLELDTGSQMLGPGEHRFAFSFVVDSTATPYERCAYGRTYHKVIATAPGLGKLGSELSASQNIALVVNPSEHGGLPPGFSLETETYNDVLGPVGVNLSSKYLLVAGFLKLGLIIPSFNAPVQLEDIKVYLYQNVQLQSRKDPERKEMKRMVIPLWSYRKESTKPIGRYNAGQEFSLIQQFRLGDDDIIRSTTCEKSKTGIRISHKLALVVHFTPLENNPDKETKELKIATDAVLTSCCCVVEYLQLPKYTSQPSTADLDAAFLGLCSSCLCRLAESKNILDLYGIPPEDIKAAQLRVEQQEPVWKEEDEYEREMRTQQEVCERQLARSPSPPSYAIRVDA